MSSPVSKDASKEGKETKLSPTQLAILRAKEARAAKEAALAEANTHGEAAAAKLAWVAQERAKLNKTLDNASATISVHGH